MLLKVIELAVIASVLAIFLRSRSRQLNRVGVHGHRWPDGYSADVSYRDFRDSAKSYRGRLMVNMIGTPRGVRDELNYSDRRRISIWRQEGNQHWSLNPDAKTFWKPRVESKLISSTTPGPIGIEGQKEVLGRDNFHGREVEKWRITKPDGSFQEYWEDVRLHACVKSIEPGVGEYEVINIREGKQDSKWFEVPSDYVEAPPRGN